MARRKYEKRQWKCGKSNMTLRMIGCKVNFLSQTQGEMGQKELIKAILNYKDSIENRSEFRCI